VDPTAERAVIEAAPLAEPALAWMRPEDLFFMQIQGSGVLDLPGGRRIRAVFAASNGKPFVGLARVMREDGLMADKETSQAAIHAWLAAHRGPEADALMRRNPRYIFFRVEPDDGAEPAGAAGVPLPAGRALAMDASRHAMGELYWIDASAPALTGAFPTYRRLAVALDVGGAIKGEVRADLYIGRGEAAGREAGRVRHVLKLYRLVPREDSEVAARP
jgi:membrane-bound lytic murein transglycosylase A